MKMASKVLISGTFVFLFLVLIWGTAYGEAGTDTLWGGETLNAGQSLTLSNGGRTLVMQSDGNLVLYGREVERLLWQSGTGGNPGAYYQMQADGNFVILSADHTALWSSKTWGNRGSELVLEDDGNLVVYSPPRPGSLWDSETTGNPGAYYKMQADGNFVVYSADHEALWSSKTSGHPEAELFIMDGNLIVFSKPFTEPVWSSQTYGNPDAELVMQSDGDLVIYSAEGKALWATGTYDHSGAKKRMDDGELQVYQPSYCRQDFLISPICYPLKVLWRSGTAGVPDPELVMQNDGNLVINSTASNMLWETGTGGHPDSELVMEDDGNLVLYSGPEPQVLWESRTGGDDHTGAELVMQADGNLVILTPPVRKAIWSSQTSGNPGAELVMQADGSLVIYTKDRKPIWASKEFQINPFPHNPYLKLRSDGNLVVYWDTSLKWSTNTFMPWMEKLGDVIADFSIRELAIPGTHDSGTYGLNDQYWADDGNIPKKGFEADGYLPWHVEVHLHWVKHTASWWPHIPYWTVHTSFTPHARYMKKFAKTQGLNFNIYYQLGNGIRYFDMRVLYDDRYLFLVHTLRGPGVFNAINTINDYLREHPYEIVILDFSHFYTQHTPGSGIPDEWNGKLIDHINNTLGDLLIPPPDNVNDLSIFDIWASGKQVIVFYEQDGPHKASFWPGSKLRSKWLDKQSWGRSEYTTGLKDEMDREATCVVNLWPDCENADTKLWVMQGILTFAPGALWQFFKDLEWGKVEAWLNGNESAAESVNDHVRDWVLNGEHTQDINILLGDWAETSELVQTVIQINLKKAGLDHVNPGIEGLPLDLTEAEPAPSTQLEETANTIPEVVPPADIRLQATGLWTVAELGEGVAYDYVDGWLAAAHDAGSRQFPIGVHTVTWSSLDAAGVMGTATQIVRIVAHSPVVDKTVLWPMNHKMLMVTIQANVVASLKGQVTLSAFVASNEPAEGQGNGDKAPDWGEPMIDQDKGIIRIPLRAESSELGYGRIYTVTVVVTDSEGNQSEAIIHVDVLRENAKIRARDNPGRILPRKGIKPGSQVMTARR